MSRRAEIKREGVVESVVVRVNDWPTTSITTFGVFLRVLRQRKEP